MAVDFGQRFSELTKQAEAIIAARKQVRSSYFEGVQVDENEMVKWQVNARHLISLVCGRDSEHFLAFEANQKAIVTMDTNYTILLRQQAVFLAAKDDYEGGYFTRLRDLIQADVFANELEQADELFRKNHIVAAAVIAGTVLETTLRQLCKDHQLPAGSLDRMNADLAKAGVYNSVLQKRITALAAIRNSAAHGKPDEFTADGVSAMIRDVESFVATKPA
jgi:hypothetical protein